MTNEKSKRLEQAALTLFVSIVADTHPDLDALHADLVEAIDKLDVTKRVTGIDDVDEIKSHLYYYLAELQKVLHERHHRHTDH